MRIGRDHDAVCRNGGDEFLYLLVNPQGRDNMVRIACDTLTNIARPLTVALRAHQGPSFLRSCATST